jgi:predicted acetyltransferase
VAGYDMRPIERGEVEAFVVATAEAFHDDPHPETVAMWGSEVEPERTLAIFAGDEIVGTSGIVSRELTVPGATLPMAGISAVGVHTVHRRRGLLSRMMRGQLEAIHERGSEPVAALWASEAGIYGRWGYGVATLAAELQVRSPDAQLLQPPPEERPRALEPSAALADMAAVYEAERPRRAGLLDRTEHHWERRVWDPEHRRDGANRLRALVHDAPGGGPAGYVLYAIRKGSDGPHPDDVVEVRELLATTPGTAAALWEELLRMSLANSVHLPLGPADEPLPHMLANPRAVAMRLGDALFVRVVDVSGALAARTYAAPVDVVLDVADELCPWNAGRWRLAGDAAGAGCERTAAPADLALDVRALGSAYLGGPTLAALAAAGRVTEATPGALAAASTAFRGARAPWCPEVF